MDVLRVVGGRGTGPTALSASDAALAWVDLHDYDLLGVVEARATLARGEAGPACAAIGEALPREGEGVIYEASGTDPGETRRALRDSARPANAGSTTTGRAARPG